MKPRALDLFCGAGGATRGLQLAGFHTTGVDINPQPRYVGDAFFQADAMTFDLEGFDFIWASPPCQAYCTIQFFNKRGKPRNHPRLIDPIRDRLWDWNGCWVIENVIGAPLRKPFMLCGSTFGLLVRRHRLFEASDFIFEPECTHQSSPRPIAVYGDHPQGERDKSYRINRARSLEQAREAMGIDWMSWKEITQSIPPAYSKYIGEQMMPHVLRAMAERRVA